MSYDVVIIGGGPGGLSAALALGRARKRVLLCDAGPRRNAAAVHIHNFVTRDGTPPDEFRAVGRAQLALYPHVEVEDVHVHAIGGSRGAFQVDLGGRHVEARRIVLCTGMIDEPPALPGFRELWGRSIFQCPYCHGYEVRDRRWGYLARAEDAAHMLPFALQARGWTSQMSVFSNGHDAFPEETRASLAAAGIRLITEPIAELVGRDGALEVVQLQSGERVACEILFAHPPQRHVELVAGLGFELDEFGFVRTDPMTRATSIPGIYAAGDLSTRMQGAILAAAAGTHAAAAVNMELTMELAVSGALP